MHPQMMHNVANHDPYFIQMRDEVGRLSLSTKQKLTYAMRMLTYNFPVNHFDDTFDIAESTTIKIQEYFTKTIWNVYY